MADRSMLFRNPAGYAGLWANCAALLSSGAHFLESRLALASKEAKAAGIHLATLVACFVAAALLGLLGYLLLIVFAIVGLAHLFGVSWIWIALVVALLHFGGAIVCVVIARGQFKRPVFRDTATVLKEDTEWLKNLNQAKAQRS
ncbi:MAG: phage holin family protein [Chthoniobacterales bacterium]|nr:phage holin family protein [Chthoniobacterales bacterium]